MAELRINLVKIPTTDMIHLHREIGDIIYTDLLKETWQVSKLQSSKKRVEYLLRKEKVENKSHQMHIKKLQVELLVLYTWMAPLRPSADILQVATQKDTYGLRFA